MSYVLTFTAGIMIGGILGVVMMSLCAISGQESRREEEYFERKND